MYNLNFNPNKIRTNGKSLIRLEIAIVRSKFLKKVNIAGQFGT